MQMNMLHDLLKASYKRNKEAELIGNQYNVKLDHHLSNSEHKVFHDPNTNSSSVVFTGTRKFGDLITDGAVAVGLGKYTKRFKDSDKVIKDIKNKYPSTNITASGHSLGGTLSEHVKADKKITYNKGVGLGDIGKTIRNNQTDIRTTYDPISILSNTQKHKNKMINIDSAGGVFNAHSTKNLIK
jgi:hypothetical protein